MPETMSLTPPSIAELGDPSLDAARWGAESALKALLVYQVEGLHFVARRAQSDLEFIRHCRDCQGWQDALQLQQTWLSGAVADYAEEWGRILGAGFALANSSFTPLQSLVQRGASAPELRRAA